MFAAKLLAVLPHLRPCLHQILLLYLNMAASSNNTEIKELIKAAVKEVLEEETKKDDGVTLGYPQGKAKAKAKSKVAVQFDETRRMTPTWGSDPRMLETQWPCMGSHVEVIGNNKWGQWQECKRCNLRLAYTPAINAPATQCKVDHAPNVTEALERLRAAGWQPSDLQGNTVKNMIKVVASEKVTTRPSKSASKAMTKKKTRPVESVEEIPVDSEESFEAVQAEKKEEKQK
jgi:hypothetical protein